MKRFIGLIGVCSIIFLWSGKADSTISDCEVTASGMFGTGESFNGTASDVGAVETIAWLHTASGVSFATMVPDPDGVECRLNGTISADFAGTGTATVNGVPGHSYLIEIEDNRGPPGTPDSVVLTASIANLPPRRINGFVDFGSPRTVVIPSFLTVTEGDSGNGWAKLQYDDITCRYRGTGPTYAFVKCGDPLELVHMPGDFVDTFQARLKIQQADRSFDLTSVEVEIGTGTSIPTPGAPDFYSIFITDPGGAIIYDFDGMVEDGDIAITLLP